MVGRSKSEVNIMHPSEKIIRAMGGVMSKLSIWLGLPYPIVSSWTTATNQ